MKSNFPCRNLRHTLLAAVLISTAVLTVVAQETKTGPPRVAGATVPLYPPLARAANVQGVIHVKITTDGHRTVTAHAQDGPKLLAVAAEENARTWFFTVHEPTTFTVIYRYKLVPGMKGDPDSPEVLIRLPFEVEVRILPSPSNGDHPSETR